METCFPSGTEILLSTRSKVVVQPAPIKPWVLSHCFPGRHQCTRQHSWSQDELSASCVTSLGEESWLRPNFAPPTFSLVDFASYPFEVISQSGEYNHMLIPVSQMGGGFGDPSSPSPCLGIVALCLETGDGLPKIVALRHC